MSFIQGNYDYYLERRALEQQVLQSEEQVKKEKKAKNTGYRTKQQKSADAKRKLRMKELETLIAGCDEEITSMENSLSDPDVMADYVKMNEVCSRIEEKKSERSELEDEWFLLVEEE